MRLLKFTSCGEISYTEFGDDNVPPYAVLSHTWGPEDEEVTFKDLEEDAGKSKFGSTGYNKIQFCGKQAACHGIAYFWVDTCCIDKSSSAELSEAINSMFNPFSRVVSLIHLSLVYYPSCCRSSICFLHGVCIQ